MNSSGSGGGVAAAPPASRTTLRVLLAEDHQVVREGIKTLINSQPDMEVVGEASDGKEAWEYVRKLQSSPGNSVDIIVMDVSMPNWNGAEATIQIKRLWPDVQILALSMHEDKSYLRTLLEAGASGYVLKRSAAEELIRAIRNVAQGGTYLDPSLSATVAEALTRSGNTAGRGSLRGETEGAALSDREREVLKLISQGFTNKEIGTRLFLSVKTIETYKARSMEKLGLNGRADIVRYALAQGWLTNLE